MLKLPEEPRTDNEATKEALKGKVQEITSDFTKEVEICCDLAHPNLVAMLGYATEPGLYMMQEVMEGSSIDQQLYVERWKPTQVQVLKVAADVARGVCEENRPGGLMSCKRFSLEPRRRDDNAA